MPSNHNGLISTLRGSFSLLMPAPGTPIDLSAGWAAVGTGLGAEWSPLAMNPDGGAVAPLLGPQSVFDIRDAAWVQSVALYASFADGLIQYQVASNEAIQVALGAFGYRDLDASAQVGMERWFSLPALNAEFETEAEVPRIAGGAGVAITGRQLYLRINGDQLLDTMIIDPTLAGLPAWFEFRVKVLHSYPLIPTIDA